MNNFGWALKSNTDKKSYRNFARPIVWRNVLRTRSGQKLNHCFTISLALSMQMTALFARFIKYLKLSFVKAL